MQQNQQQENSKMGTKSQKRISVTFSESFNIPDEQGSKSPLSKKYIFTFSNLQMTLF